MSQRRYEWAKDQVMAFLLDLEETKNGRFEHQMGDLMLLEKPDCLNDLYDGQQRILSLVVILFSLSETEGIELELKDTIINILTNKKYDRNIPDEVEVKFIERYGDGCKIPRLHCINPDDQDALVNILNGTKTAADNKSKLIRTYSLCKEFFNHTMSGDIKTETLEWWRYLSFGIVFTQYRYKDEEYAANRFEWLNNRGLALSHLDLAKNKIIVQLDRDKKIAFYDTWEKLRNLDTKYSVKIYDVAIQIYNNKMCLVKASKRVKDYHCCTPSVKIHKRCTATLWNSSRSLKSFTRL